MIKFGVAAVRGPHEVVPMTRLKVEEASTALHVVADALQCTSVEAEEQICRLSDCSGYNASESERESEGEDRNLQSENEEESEVSGSESD